MKRAMAEFFKDDVGDWVTKLSCGHRQHVRHDPPFINRLWVTTAEGRSNKIGEDLDCPLCDRLELPEDYKPYKKTLEFTNQTVPKGLLKNHSTKAGVWGKIHVLEGQLLYKIEDGRELLLDSSTAGIVVPEMLHHVKPKGPVRFFVEFYRSE